MLVRSDHAPHLLQLVERDGGSLVKRHSAVEIDNTENSEKEETYKNRTSTNSSRLVILVPHLTCTLALSSYLTANIRTRRIIPSFTRTDVRASVGLSDKHG